MSYKDNKFKNASGAHHLKSLFYETAGLTERKFALYTLKSEDHEGYPSIRRLYIETNDPTEYQFARLYFDGYSHFKKVSGTEWFSPILQELREELDLKLRSEALVQIRMVSSDTENKMHFSANRFLLSGEYLPKSDKRGRPSKASIVKEAEKMFISREEIADDYERLKLNG